MFRMTKFTGYGVVLLMHMARQPDDETHSVTELANEAYLPLPMAQKVLKRLARKGLVESQRGVNGGYRLARPADRITALDIIDALEGAVALTQCAAELDLGSKHDRCEREAYCAASHAWQEINLIVQNALRNVSLRDMVALEWEKSGLRITISGE
ncbi:SUF system Fe-S cluster assembly regulator [Candidatus Sumerlaeota bacterium]|nr:SUF system Fe-S cluster assembly regulator [Candidatus Sumerlaeota bacterium]